MCALLRDPLELAQLDAVLLNASVDLFELKAILCHQL